PNRSACVTLASGCRACCRSDGPQCSAPSTTLPPRGSTSTSTTTSSTSSTTVPSGTAPTTSSTTTPAATTTTTSVLPSSLGIRWTGPPPGTVATGESFPLQLEVSGGLDGVYGEVFACSGDLSLSQCQSNAVGDEFFTVTPDFFFGPPDTIDFVA